MDLYDIFISYRRVGGASFARILQQALKNRGYSVFLDFDELKDGVFDRRIEQAIQHSKIFVFILSPNALERCKNEDDWVRREIECALVSQCHIVPVNPDALFDGNFDTIDGLPYFIKTGLSQHQISKIMTDDLFDDSMNNFVRNRIAGIVQPKQNQIVVTPEAGAVEVHFETNLACKVLRFKKEIATLTPDDDNLVYLKRGTHKLSIVSLENDADQFTQTYTIADDCEFFEIDLEAIRDTRAEQQRIKEETERKIIAEDDAKYEIFFIRRAGCKIFGFKKDGIEVVPAKYDDVYEFSGGLASVNLNGRWGFIDKTGKEIIPLMYDYAYVFSEGLSKVKCNGKYGFIDRTGKEIIPLMYDDAWSFSEGLTKVKLNGKYGFIDRTGKEIIPLIYDDACLFSEGLASVNFNGKWGFIDKTGKKVIPLKYDYALSFSEGLASVNFNGKWGFIDKIGEEIILFKYDSTYSFGEGLAPVNLNEKWGFIDKTGEKIIPLIYDYAGPFIKGLALVKLNGELFEIDKTGKRVD